MSHASAAFGADLSSVGEARRFVRRALVDLGAEEMEFEAAQLVSELVTNSVIHAGTPFEVDLYRDGESLRIAVSDGSRRSPVAKSHSAQATTGRGLKLVATLSDAWGTETRSDGKTVWCTLRLDSMRRALPLLAELDDDLRSSAGPQRASRRGRSSSRNLDRAGIAA